jgi:hypothetical protein
VFRSSRPHQEHVVRWAAGHLYLIAATNKRFWSAHYAEEIEAIKIALIRGMTPEAMVARLVELQSLLGRHTLSPVDYLKGLRAIAASHPTITTDCTLFISTQHVNARVPPSITATTVLYARMLIRGFSAGLSAMARRTIR